MNICPLPCVLSVNRNWNTDDLKFLIMYLVNTFELNYDQLCFLGNANTYFSTFTKSVDYNPISLKNTLHKQQRKCLLIKKNFSFGYLRPEVCFLCPFSAFFKNYNKEKELRFLYHIVSSKTYSLNYYLNFYQKNVSDCFKSYFPLYSNNSLIGAAPLYLIADIFSRFPKGYMSEEPEYSKFLLKNYFFNLIPKVESFAPYENIYDNYSYSDYRLDLLKSTKKIVLEIKFTNRNTRQISDTMLKRLFLLISDSEKCKMLSPSEIKQFSYDDNTLQLFCRKDI